MSERSPARRCLACLDLTDLSDHANEASAQALCELTGTPYGEVAAVCVWPRFVALARDRLEGTGVRVATVVNFPDGGEDADELRGEIAAVLASGADEIDMVAPWRAIRDGRLEVARAVLAAGREEAGSATLKIILETGELKSHELIALAAGMAIEEGGADFLKSSTGKAPVSATPEAIAVMLDVIAGCGRAVGLKVSGGVREAADAARYLAMADRAMADRREEGEPYWATSARFRIGASALREALITQIESEPGSK